MSDIGSIFITENPAAGYEQFLLSLPPDNSHFADAWFANYIPADRAKGGPWNVVFDLHARENVLLEMFESGMDRHVEAWGYGLEQDFEGTIHEMVLMLHIDRFTKSMDSMLNSIHMRADYDADGSPERSSTLINQESIDRFLTKEEVIGGGELNSLTVADQAVQTFLNLRGFPMPEGDLGSVARGGAHLQIFCKGYIHTLDRRIYNQTADTTDQGMSSQIIDVIAVADFIASSEIEANATIVSKEQDADRKLLDLVMEYVELGDSDNQRWIAYMKGKTITDVIGRKFVLAQAAPATVPVSV